MTIRVRNVRKEIKGECNRKQLGVILEKIVLCW